VPLNLQVLRNDKPVKFRPFDGFVLNAVYTAAMAEADPDGDVNDDYTWGSLPKGKVVDWTNLPIYYMEGCPLLEEGRQELKENHTFTGKRMDDTNRRVILKKGDVLTAWRSSK
jgi:hypothetical protein